MENNKDISEEEIKRIEEINNYLLSINKYKIDNHEEEFFAGELIDTDGNIYNFKKIEDKIIFKDIQNNPDLNIKNIENIKTIPISQKYDNKKTTDMVLYYNDEESNERKYVFIERKYPPSGLAFAGGQIEDNENSIVNALKELEEELSLKIEKKDLVHFGNIKTNEIRGSVNSSIFLVDLNKTFTSNIKKVLELLVASTDAISFVKMSFNQVMGNKDEKRNVNSLVPHHKEILKDVDLCLNCNQKNKQLDTNLISPKITLDLKSLKDFGLKILSKNFDMKDPEFNKKQN